NGPGEAVPHGRLPRSRNSGNAPGMHYVNGRYRVSGLMFMDAKRINAELIGAPTPPSTFTKTGGKETAQSEEAFLATAPLDELKKHFESKYQGEVSDNKSYL